MYEMIIKTVCFVSPSTCNSNVRDDPSCSKLPRLVLPRRRRPLMLNAASDFAWKDANFDRTAQLNQILPNLQSKHCRDSVKC